MDLSDIEDNHTGGHKIEPLLTEVSRIYVPRNAPDSKRVLGRVLDHAKACTWLPPACWTSAKEILAGLAVKNDEKKKKVRKNSARGTKHKHGNLSDSNAVDEPRAIKSSQAGAGKVTHIFSQPAPDVGTDPYHSMQPEVSESATPKTGINFLAFHKQGKLDLTK
ncbi:hypothetical protein C8Q80DRAFT_1273407 [Daedaleopsis nitida]|nr:hypothetical protein C8Q80DRAFT_1273407 [Daedaleopsis nitida]